MKTFVTILLLASNIYSFAGSTKNGIIKITTTSQADLMRFNLKMIDANHIVISLSGIKDEFGTISVINANGESVFFEFVKENQEEYFFNLSNLEKGTYYVKLNANNEIRMKTIVVE